MRKPATANVPRLVQREFAEVLNRYMAKWKKAIRGGRSVAKAK